MARPKKNLDIETFKKLCGIMCTLSEIAGFFNCSEDTVERWCKRELKISFADAFKKYSANGKISLRRTQFKLAEKNASMAIWLGKQILGQRDSFDYIDTTAIEKLDAILKETQEQADNEIF